MKSAYPTRFAPRLESLEERAVPAVPDLTLGHSVARLWDEGLRDAIRVDTPRPTVHARNLYHTSLAMYDAWAIFEPGGHPLLAHESVQAPDVLAAQNEAVSFAAYRVLTARFAHSPGAATS